jgi:hypothetical protein
VTQLLGNGLFGSQRKLFKRIASFDAKSHPTLHKTLAGLPYKQLVQVSDCFAIRLAKKTGCDIQQNEILIDAPPKQREIEFRLQVCCRDQFGRGQHRWRSLAEISPVTESLAHLQFDYLVKQVRIFGSHNAFGAVRNTTGLEDILLEASNDALM